MAWWGGQELRVLRLLLLLLERREEKGRKRKAMWRSYHAVLLVAVREAGCTALLSAQPQSSLCLRLHSHILMCAAA